MKPNIPFHYQACEIYLWVDSSLNNKYKISVRDSFIIAYLNTPAKARIWAVTENGIAFEILYFSEI